MEKLLEDTGIKLAAVASDIMGVSGRATLEALTPGNARVQPAVTAPSPLPGSPPGRSIWLAASSR